MRWSLVIGPGLSVVAAAAALSLCGAVPGGTLRPRDAARPAGAASRGRYLVDRALLCGDCHTPRLPTGAPDPARYLQGAELDFAPTHPIPGWASHAPDITAAGMAHLSVGRLAAMLEGKARFGPPMPAYRLSRQDAVAVATYLKSVRPRAARR